MVTLEEECPHPQPRFCCVDPVFFIFETRLKLGEHPNLVKLLSAKPISAEDPPTKRGEITAETLTI